MAVTKTHPIKSTLKAAIDYILNPEKTDGKLLASSFGCGLETADIEFAWTREAAGDRGTHLGRHLIQSFAVGETTPEEAHKIGMELAGAVLGGKYEQDGLTADGKWVFLVRLRRGKLDKLLVHQIVKGNLPFPLPFKLQNLVQGGTADNSLAKGVVPALDIFLIGYLVGHGNSPF